MKQMQSFLMCFYILDQCYFQCQENDLWGFLGAISPELWGDGKPIDKAIYNDWRDRNDIESLDNQNIIKAVYNFLEYYQIKFGFDFSKTIILLKNIADKAMIEKAEERTKQMYQKYNYVD